MAARWRRRHQSGESAAWAGGEKGPRASPAVGESI
jgi:hypothetical protein